MDLSISAFMLMSIGSVIYKPTSTVRVCKFKYCNFYDDCYPSFCYGNFGCYIGTINITTVFHGNNMFAYDFYNCRQNCYGSVSYSLAYTNEIGKLCDGKKSCSLSQWQTGSYWNLDIDFYCQGPLPRTKSMSSSTRRTTHQVETTSSATTYMTTPVNASSRFNESKFDENNSSEKFHVIAVASSLTACIVVLGIVVVVIVCIKRRKANKGNSDSTIVQCNGSPVTTQAVTNRSYDETNTADRSTETKKPSEQDYEYAEALISINTTNENEYNTLNQTSTPIKADPNYDHIPKQSKSVNETLTRTNEEIYNTLNVNTNCNGLNDHPNYDHVSKQTPPEDQTYSHIKSAKSDHNQSKYQVHDTDMYSHLKQ